MRVVIVTNSLSGGGAERSMNTLANNLATKIKSLTLVTVNEGIEDLVPIQCNIIKLERQKSGGVSELIRIIRMFRQVLFKLNPDFIIANCDLPEVLSLFAPLKVRIIVVEHSNPSWINRPKLGILTRAFLILRRANFVAVSNHLLVWPFKRKPNLVIENSLALSCVSLKPRQENRMKRLWFVGRLDSIQKRPEVVLEVAKATGLSVNFIGEGAAKPDLEELASQYGVKVEFLGVLKNPWAIVNPNEILIVPSLFEGDGLVVLEAMMNSVPLLVSNNSAFARFNLPNQNMCNSVEEFIERVNTFRTKTEELIVPKAIYGPILDKRNVELISSEWMNYLIYCRSTIK